MELRGLLSNPDVAERIHRAADIKAIDCSSDER
jgi:hypothetical protein